MVFKNNCNYDSYGIVIINSKSKVIENVIKKSHRDGIQIRWVGQGNICCPDVENNEIHESNGWGILVQGDNANPKIINNLVENNKKWGIKLWDGAKVDSMKKNRIKKNYTQGILMVEGSSAIIEENTVCKNLKANIAFGGQGSQNTKIINNIITESVAEGIFCVEGHENTVISGNTVEQNKDGIVLYNSQGVCRENKIHENQRSGILIGGQTSADVSANIISDNICSQIMIKDPARTKMTNKMKKKQKELMECNDVKE